jgi:hypothetical protein
MPVESASSAWEARDASRLEEATHVAEEAIAQRFGRCDVDGQMQANIVTVERWPQQIETFVEWRLALYTKISEMTRAGNWSVRRSFSP